MPGRSPLDSQQSSRTRHIVPNRILTGPDKSVILPFLALGAFRGSDTARYLLRHPVHAASASIE